mmetsp:Transcript_10414/g.28464  ORF Transcript_10414/g.28464 Transcript_10414/m.28464 type:complete len:202 (+) Transcript_10414:444-1049(+)
MNRPRAREERARQMQRQRSSLLRDQRRRLGQRQRLSARRRSMTCRDRQRTRPLSPTPAGSSTHPFTTSDLTVRWPRSGCCSMAYLSARKPRPLPLRLAENQVAKHQHHGKRQHRRTKSARKTTRMMRWTRRRKSLHPKRLLPPTASPPTASLRGPRARRLFMKRRRTPMKRRMRSLQRRPRRSQHQPPRSLPKNGAETRPL